MHGTNSTDLYRRKPCNSLEMAEKASLALQEFLEKPFSYAVSHWNLNVLPDHFPKCPRNTDGKVSSFLKSLIFLYQVLGRCDAGIGFTFSFLGCSWFYLLAFVRYANKLNGNK